MKVLASDGLEKKRKYLDDHACLQQRHPITQAVVSTDGLLVRSKDNCWVSEYVQAGNSCSVVVTGHDMKGIYTYRERYCET